ncbi:hypothetical protein [Pseudomonas sp. BLCC-B112]|uniref:hypothetical protein n=1 Tax=Pseudomonas sp. BLCC-B112 TaxID=3025319 RepID=UPI00234C5F67|nr:hypothetical protein [Pseudomonas sp. BLCC-B112]MDC7816113.1 hypothetical protein [Pseudomonas sp. BLCC-B112]
MKRRMDQILELFQELLEVDGYNADDIERVRQSLHEIKPLTALGTLSYMHHFTQRLHATRLVEAAV